MDMNAISAISHLQVAAAVHGADIQRGYLALSVHGWFPRSTPIIPRVCRQRELITRPNQESILYIRHYATKLIDAGNLACRQLLVPPCLWGTPDFLH